jgi:hypothetical protein
MTGFYFGKPKRTEKAQVTEVPAILDNKPVVIVCHTRRKANTPVGWCVRCQECTYSRIDLGGEIEASTRAIRHKLSRHHTVVAWKEGEEDTKTTYRYTPPPSALRHEGNREA